MKEITPCPMGTTPEYCIDAESCNYWDACITRAVAIDEGTTAPSVEIRMGYAIEHDPEIPSVEDEYLDMMEDMTVYPQNYTAEEIERTGLTIKDVYGGFKDE